MLRTHGGDHARSTERRCCGALLTNGMIGDMGYLQTVGLLTGLLFIVVMIMRSVRANGTDGHWPSPSDHLESGSLFARREKELPRLDLASVDEADLIRSAQCFQSTVPRLVKRAFDIVASLAMLIMLAPLLAVTAIAIRLDSPGPVLYRQTRIGRGGLPFDVVKFRSMVSDAEKSGAQYASINDSRITRVGHIIRHFRIDEIPQAINVLRGEMSFVGPRPERPEFTASLEGEIPHYNIRHLVKPGITGWAQVKYEYAASTEGAREKLRYDLYYISRYSFLMDVAIILLTVKVVLFGLGSR